MEIMTVCIDKIIKVEEHKRTVTVTMDTQTYGGRTKGEVHAFLKDRWPEIQQRKHFEETQSLDRRNVELFEAMSDDEWYRWKYEKKITDFTDEEIAAEFNRRLADGVFHRLGVKVMAVVTERR